MSSPFRLEDFKVVQSKDASCAHFSFRDYPLEVEIRLEPCFDGYCVALYNSNDSLLGPKVCTDLSDKSGLGRQWRPKEAIIKALEIAGEFYNDYTGYVIGIAESIKRGKQ